MLPLTKGCYTARLAISAHDVNRAQNLRHLCFIANRGLANRTTDADTFDNLSQHVLVEDTRSGVLVCCFRLTHFAFGATIDDSYSAQFYDLSRFAAYRNAMAELGRFCIHPNHPDPDILRVALGALTRIVDATDVQMLFGCTSFHGADPALHQDALALLKKAHLAPAHYQPGQKSRYAYRFAETLRDTHPNHTAAVATMPPLLRTYLAMGAWVSDHAVIDAALNTLHVFTGLEIGSIPPNRACLLRALAD